MKDVTFPLVFGIVFGMVIVLLSGIAIAQDAWNGGRFDGAVLFNGPTSMPTNQPLHVIDGYGVNNLLEVRDSATPVFTIHNGGEVTCKVLRYDSSGKKLVCGATTITGTGTLNHGLSTPEAVYGALKEDLDVDHAIVTFANAQATVTAKVWKLNATPAAALTPVTVYWCAEGTP